MSAVRMRSLWSRFRRDAQGLALVEFGILLPIMLIIYCGMVDVVQMVMANRKVTQLTLALGDLTARAATVAPSDIQNIFKAAETILMPFDGATAKMVISSVVIDASGVAKVCWSSAPEGQQARGRGTEVALPDSVRIPGTSVIMAQANYAYKPITGYVLKSSAYTLGDKPIYTRPRLGQAGGTQNIEQVVRTGTAACPGY
ncbi:TadE/TadG family type IV pilus assembly protein [Bosea thiooxidans]|nr:pilus assembly protein [Bosea sp. (in: a-proteobacteria)]